MPWGIGSIRETTTLETRLPNRRLLHDRFRQALAQAQRQHKQVVVLLLDLDGFKGVNDRTLCIRMTGKIIAV